MSNKFLKDMLTESDNQTWCLMRVGGFVGIIILVVLTVYAAIHYGLAAGTGFEPSKISDALSSFCNNSFKVLTTTTGAVAVKNKFGGDAPCQPPAT